MVFALIGPHPESTTAHFHPYVSEFQYVPQYHPSRNPDCTLQWQRREGQFEHSNRRRSSFEEPLIDQDHPWIEIRAVLVRCSKTRKEVYANAICFKIIGITKLMQNQRRVTNYSKNFRLSLFLFIVKKCIRNRNGIAEEK